LVPFLDKRDFVVDIPEFQKNQDKYKSLELPAWLARLEQPWLIIPMRHHSELIGFIVLNKPRIWRNIDREDNDLLKTICKQAASYLVLLEANETLSQAEKFAVFNRLSAYVVHDLKNMIAQLGLVVKNAEKHKGNPEFLDDAIMTISNATAKMTRLLDQLKKGRFDSRDSSILDLGMVLDEIKKEYSGYTPTPEFHYEGNEIKIRAAKDRFHSVIGHLIRNAQEATPDSGYVKISLSSAGKNARIEIIDNGVGMDREFIQQRLFQPFDTTKGNAGMGVGVYESKEFITSIGGKLDVVSSPGEGTVFSITVPRIE
jgi:putative PEP-CTERM system histidine kinase